MAQWLRLHTLNAEDLGSIPGQRTRSHMPQLRVCMLQLKIPHAAKKIEAPTRHNKDLTQPTKNKLFKYTNNKNGSLKVYGKVDVEIVTTQMLQWQ